MSLTVMKFGGTSVGDAGCIRRAAIVRESAERDRVVVVVSALAGVTGTILKAVRAATASSQAELASCLDQLEQGHHSVIAELFETRANKDGRGGGAVPLPSIAPNPTEAKADETIEISCWREKGTVHLCVH